MAESRFNVSVDPTGLSELPPHMVLSRVTAEMWKAGVPEGDMEAYCEAVAGLSTEEVIAVSREWVTLKA
jgi:hypothetical protein